MTIHNRYLKIGKIGIITAAVLAIGYCLVSIITAYSTDTFIDIHTGDTKEVRKICYIQVREEIKQTEFSTLVRKYIGEQKQPEWKHCHGSYGNIFMVRGNSSSAKWGPILYQSGKFCEIVNPNSISESELKKLLQECLGYMERGDAKGFDKFIDSYYKSHEDK